MAVNLIQSLQEIKDFRTSRGRRYPLWLILLLVVMGTISGCRSYLHWKTLACATTGQ